MRSGGFIKNDKVLLIYNIRIPIRFLHRSLSYIGRGVDTSLKRNDGLANAEISLQLQGSNAKDWTIRLGANTNASAANMLNLVNVTNTTDPLNVYLGSPDLRNARRNNFNLGFGKGMHNLNFYYSYISNALARGVVYNPSNGVRTYKMYNIDGNWNANAKYSLYQQFGSNKQFDITSDTYGSYSHSVDYSGSSTSTDMNLLPKRMVNYISASESLRLNWQKGQHRISAHAEARYNR